MAKKAEVPIVPDLTKEEAEQAVKSVSKAQREERKNDSRIKGIREHAKDRGVDNEDLIRFLIVRDFPLEEAKTAINAFKKNKFWKAVKSENGQDVDLSVQFGDKE